jgi:hypothetical protein
VGILGGRLIFPQWAAILRLDPAATASPITGGQHPIFREPIPSYTPTPGTSVAVRGDTRRYMPPVFIQTQIERYTYRQFRMGGGGDVPDSKLTLVMLATDLKRLGLLDPATGNPLLKIDDRCLGTWASCSAAKVAVEALLSPAQGAIDPPGFWATEIKPGGEGLGGSRNLIVMSFDDREHGVVRSGN